MALHPSGRFIYAVPPASLRREEGITVFSLRGGAAPTRVAGSPFSSGADASVCQVDPTWRYLYCAEPRMAGTLLNKYVVDATTGALASRSSTPAPYASNVQAPMFDATDGRLYDANGVILSYGIDRATGTLLSSNWTTTQAAWGTSAIAIDTTSAPLEFVSETVVAGSEADARVSSFRLSTLGTLTPVSVMGMTARAISLDPLARVAHVVSDYYMSFVGIDSGTSTLSAFPYDLPLSIPAPATFSPTGRYLYVPGTTSTTLRTYLNELATGDWDSQLPSSTLQTAVQEAFVHPNGRFYTRPPADGSMRAIDARALRVPPLRVAEQWRSDLDAWLRAGSLAGRPLVLVQAGNRRTTKWWRPRQRPSNSKYWPERVRCVDTRPGCGTCLWRIRIYRIATATIQVLRRRRGSLAWLDA